jgi:RNA polymerase sigma-70 factor (sigma-E family)
MTDPDVEFSAVVGELLPRLRRLGYLLSGDWHRADDLVQATLERLYSRWRRARTADDIDAYVRTMLVRVFLNEQRTGWWSRVAVTHEVPQGTASAPDSESRLDMRQMLAAVPARQRAVLVLRFYADLSVEQTAGALNCSVGTVKSQTSHGLAALRKALGPSAAEQKSQREAQ